MDAENVLILDALHGLRVIGQYACSSAVVSLALAHHEDAYTIYALSSIGEASSAVTTVRIPHVIPKDFRQPNASPPSLLVDVGRSYPYR
jgi:hypothetical protein